MFKIFTDELLCKVGIDNKYELTRLAIQKIRQLIKKKRRLELLNSKEKLPNIVLRELMEGKLNKESLKEKKKNG